MQITNKKCIIAEYGVECELTVAVGQQGAFSQVLRKWQYTLIFRKSAKMCPQLGHHCGFSGNDIILWLSENLCQWKEFSSKNIWAYPGAHYMTVVQVEVHVRAPLCFQRVSLHIHKFYCWLKSLQIQPKPKTLWLFQVIPYPLYKISLVKFFNHCPYIWNNL